MKTNSRRRVLISSVAMLLVALVALSTATFAWFTQDTSAEADGIVVSTSKMSSLEISDATRAYGSGFTYLNVSKTMMPTSSFDGKSWFIATATQGSNYASTTATKLDSLEARYVYADQLNIKNTGTKDVNNIKIDVTGFNNAEYLRFALVPVNSKGQNIQIPEGTAFGSYVYGLDDAKYYPITAAGAILAEDADGYEDQKYITPIAVGADGSISIQLTGVTLKPEDQKHFNLYVWFEGQDKDCYNGKAGQGTTDGTESTPNGLTFAVSGDPVEEPAAG